MIFILSETNDKVTDNVIDWLILNNAPFIRINETEIISSLFITEENIELRFENGFQVSFNEIETFWHRRGALKFKPVVDMITSNFTTQIKNHLHNEWSDIKDYLFYCLYQKKGIFNKVHRLNKLTVLQNAKAVGLNIPKWIILDKRYNLPNFSTITKAISDSLEFYTDTHSYTFYTEQFEMEESQIPNEFFPTFFQQNIEKFVDVRTIYLKGKMWSMAIYDTNIDKSIVDFRKNYDNQRNLPIDIPESIKDMIRKLMNDLHLDFGAIDLILDKNDAYYFLEVNPFGQFEMVSSPCNYSIEKEIAQILIQNEKKVN